MPRKGKIIAGITRIADFPFNPVMAIKLSYYCDYLVLGFDAQGGYSYSHKNDYVDGITWYELFKKINPFPKSCKVDMFLTKAKANIHYGIDWSIGWLDELLQRLNDIKPDYILECEADACFSDEFDEELDVFIESGMDKWFMNAICISNDGRFVPESVWCEHQRACKWFPGINYNWKNMGVISPGFCITTSENYPDMGSIFRGKTHLWHFPFFTKKLEKDRIRYYSEGTYNWLMSHSMKMYNYTVNKPYQHDYCYIKEFKKHINHFSLISCEIDPSNKCQNKCEFCYFKDIRNESELSLDDFDRLSNELKDAGVMTITFTGGGEPLCNEHTRKMALLAKEKGFRIGLITNGILIDRIKDIADQFTFIRISLDAASRETYYAIKGTEYFDLVVENIKGIVGITDVGISFVICDKNKHEIEKAKKLSDDLGVKYIQFKPENKSFSEQIKVEGAINCNRFKPDSENPCMVANQTGIIDANGDVYFCCQKRGVPEYKIGKTLNGKSFKEIWKERENIKPDISKCDTCRYMNYLKGDTQIQHYGFI